MEEDLLDGAPHASYLPNDTLTTAQPIPNPVSADSHDPYKCPAAHAAWRAGWPGRCAGSCGAPGSRRSTGGRCNAGPTAERGIRLLEAGWTLIEFKYSDSLDKCDMHADRSLKPRTTPSLQEPCKVNFSQFSCARCRSPTWIPVAKSLRPGHVIRGREGARRTASFS